MSAIADLDALAEDLGKQNDALSAATGTFETVMKTNHDLVSKHMATPKGMPVDTVRAVGDLKKAVAEYDNGGKAMLKALREALSQLSARKALTEQQAGAMRESGDDPETLKGKVEDLTSEVANLTTERTDVAERHRAALADAAARFEAERAAALAAHADDTARLRADVQRAHDDAAIAAHRLASREEHIQSLEAMLAARQEEIDRTLLENERLSAETHLLIQARTRLDTELRVAKGQAAAADVSRASDSAAFNAACRAHASETEAWARKIAEAQRSAAVARTEREAMRGRLADDHLREHIRMLQAENTALREERAADARRRAAERDRAAASSNALQAQLRTLAGERAAADGGEAARLRDALASAEAAAVSQLTAFEVERGRHAALVASLEQRAWLAEAAAGAAEADAEAARASALARASGAADGDASGDGGGAVRTRAVGVQATDVQRREAEIETAALRAGAAALSERLAAAEAREERAEAEFEARIVAQAAEAEAAVAALADQLRVANFRLQKQSQQHQQQQQQWQHQHQQQQQQALFEKQQQQSVFEVAGSVGRGVSAGATSLDDVAFRGADVRAARAASISANASANASADASDRGGEAAAPGELRRLRERLRAAERDAAAAALENDRLRVRLRAAQRALDSRRDDDDRRCDDAARGQALAGEAAAVQAWALSQSEAPAPEAGAAPPVASPGAARALSFGGDRDASRSPLGGSTTAQPTAAATTASAAQRAARLRAVDAALLAVHEESIALDERERRVQAQRAEAGATLDARAAQVKDALRFWRSAPGRAQRGPQGEGAAAMEQRLLAERDALEVQRQRLENGLLSFFTEVGAARERMFERSSQLMRERAALA